MVAKYLSILFKWHMKIIEGILVPPIYKTIIHYQSAFNRMQNLHGDVDGNGDAKSEVN